MAGYQPLHISGNTVGLVQERENFLLPNDAYPILQNFYVWRERLKRKQAFQLLGRLQRAIGTTNGSGNLTVTLPGIPLTPGVSSFTVGSTTFTDSGTATTGLVTLIAHGTGTATLNLTTGVLTITGAPTSTVVNYITGLPVMGIRTRETQNSTNDQTVFFDTVYAYVFNSSTNLFEEFLPGTTWTGTNFEFFWTTNYWIGDNNKKIFWATNFSISGDPIRYTNGASGTNWQNFTPIVDASSNKLLQALALLPFRGRLVAFNTREGTISPGASFTNRIRWSAIGTPFTTTDGSIVTTNLNVNAWRDDIRGQGGFLDIPTSEDIISVGFVRDNLVIYCERSTWQLRYTGRSISPFQIEKVNSELGVESTFSSIQFDTSLLGIGDKGIIECDSYKSERIDIKIPDFVFNLADKNNATSRIQGIRDFERRLAYWTCVSDESTDVFPDIRLLYNYENDSWAIFTDTLTSLGTFQLPSSRTWLNTNKPWIECNFPWISYSQGSPAIVGGNQQGFVEYLDQYTTNDPSLCISNIVGGVTPIVITSPGHNLKSGQIISISGIPASTPFATALNGKNFQVLLGDNSGANPTIKFRLYSYNNASTYFSDVVISNETGYVGGGVISIRDNFNITSKKFNFMDEGQSIQLGYLDILVDGTENTSPGAFSMNVYINYNDSEATNTLPMNSSNDKFFNQIIPTTQSDLSKKGGSKFWQRVFCPTRGNFLTIQYIFSNSQMNGIEQELDVQIDAQILHIRKAGRLTQI